MIKNVTILIISFLTLYSGNLLSQENWAGLEGGGLKHNSSKTDINPGELKMLWQREFYVVPEGDQEGVIDEMHLPCGHGSRNLVYLEDKIAVLASEQSGIPNGPNDYYLSILSAEDGKTLNFLKVKSSKGNSRVYRWPHYGVSMSGDNITGFAQLSWDPETKYIFIGQGAYNSSYTAWAPMENLSTFNGKLQDAVPAYLDLAQEYPNLEDAFGRTRNDLQTVFGPGEIIPFQPYTWGLSGFYDEKVSLENSGKNRYDSDFKKVYGRQGSSYYNTSSYFNLDTNGELILQTKGADWAHNTGGDMYLFNKHTGFKALNRISFKNGERLRPFTMEGAIAGNGMVFCAGASEGRLGVGRPEGNVPKRDQGLALWAYRYEMRDQHANGGYSGKGREETVELLPVFEYRFPSRFIPDTNNIQSYGQSYYECDGFFRNKAMLIDGRGIWFAWKPSAAEAVELIYADDDGHKKFPLEAGNGLYGVDIWPKISLSEGEGKKYIGYFTGYAHHRKRFIPEDTEKALKEIHGENCKNLTEKDIELTLKQAPQAGIWSKELHEPHGPAELVVFDVEKEKVKWTFNVSEAFPSIPVNGFWTYLDKIAMVVSGKYLYIGWVDLSKRQAQLLLVSFDITKTDPEPVVRTFSLGFRSGEYGKSVLFDLIAADGKLFALVTQSDKLWVRDPRWQKQHVVAMGVE
jgi:hypothetical protein